MCESGGRESLGMSEKERERVRVSENVRRR